MLMGTIDLEVPVRSVAVGLSSAVTLLVLIQGDGVVRRSRHDHLASWGIVCSRL